MDKINVEVFLTIAQTGSFRKAADRLGYTQAGISYIVGAMEESIGLSLFIRERNGVRLSPEGEELYPHFKQLDIWQRQFQEAIDELNGLEKGTVRVQIFDSISIHWIPNILRRFQDDFPRINVELITEEDSVRAEEMVLNGEVDCGFFLTKVKSKIDYFPLIKEKLVAVVGPDHPLRESKRFPVASLGDYPYVGMKYDAHTGINKIFRKQGIKANTVYRMDNDFAAMSMIEKGLGFGIFPELLLKNVPYNLKRLDFDKPQTRVISIGTANIDTCSKACLKFIEYTRKWVNGNT